MVLQLGQPAFLVGLRHRVAQVGGRRAGARRVVEGIGAIHACLPDQIQRGREIVFGLGGEADDEIRRQRNIRPRLAHAPDFFQVLGAGVAAFHHAEDAVRAGLHRQVQEAGQLGLLGVGLDQGIGEFHRMRGHETNPFQPVELGQMINQQGQIAAFALAHAAAIAVDVLPEQRDFLYALLHQCLAFLQHVVQRPAHFLATRIRHHAERTVLGATFHDRYVGGRSFRARLRQAVELLDFRKADVHRRPVAGTGLLQQFRQAVQGLRSENQVHLRAALGDRRAFLAGDTTTHADEPARLAGLPVFPFPQLGEYFLLRLFPHRTGVEQQQIGLLGHCGALVTVRALQHPGHLGRVVLVHLAAVSLDEDFRARRGCRDGHPGGRKRGAEL